MASRPNPSQPPARCHPSAAASTAKLAAPRLHALSVALGLVALTLLVRWPFHDVVGEDESFFLVIAHQWRLGVAPYIGAFDVKPPGLFAMVAMAETVFGESIAAIKALECAAVATTATALYLLGRRYLTPTAGLLGAILYITASLDLGGVSQCPELLSSAFVAPAMLIGLGALQSTRPRLDALVFAGLLIGAAVCIKQPAAFEGLVLVLVSLGNPGRPRIVSLLALLGGMAAAPVGFIALYVLVGHLDALVADAVLGAAGRVKGDGLSWGDAVLRLAPMLKPVLPLVIGASLLWVERRRIGSPQVYPTLRFLAFWGLGALGGVLAVKAMYDHYYLTLLPPLSLLSGMFIDQIPPGFWRPQWGFLSRAGLGAAALAFLLWQPLPLLAPAGGQIAAEQQSAARLAALGLYPEDHILVVNRNLAVYLFARAEPVAAVFHPMQMLCPFPQLGGRDALSEALATHPTFILLADPATRMICELPQRHSEMAAVLARDYCPVGRSDSFALGNGRDELTIYARRDRRGLDCRGDIPPAKPSNS